MTTVIAVYNSEGCVGRCDAKCHSATTAHCDCICGGRLHDSGRNAIAQNTLDILGEDLAEQLRGFADRNGHQLDELRIELPDLQLGLV